MLVCIEHCDQLSQLDVAYIATTSVSKAAPTEPQRKAPPSVVQRSSYGVHQFQSSTGSPFGLRGMTEGGLEVQLVQQLWKIYGAATVLGSNEETHAQLTHNSCSSSTSIQSSFLVTTTCHISYYLITHLPLSSLYDHF